MFLTIFTVARFYLRGVWDSPTFKGLIVVVATAVNLLLAAAVGTVFYSDFGNGVANFVGAGFYFVLTFSALQLQLLVFLAATEN